MRIVRVSAYLVAPPAGAAAGHGASLGRLGVTPQASPMAMFPRYKAARGSWQGPAKPPLVVEIETDSGVVGAAANWGGGKYACAIVEEHFAQFLIGQDPRRIELLWEQMYRASLPYGRRGVAIMALSAVDKALWDLLGRLWNEPVCNLIGGRVHDSLPVYATVHAADLPVALRHGMAGYKLIARHGPEDGRAGLLAAAAMVREARAVVGPEVELSIECYLGWNREFTVQFADLVKDTGLRWIEDPLMPDDVEGYAAIRPLVKPIQIAAGNMDFTRAAFKELLARGAVDIVQPAIEWSGGITDTRRVAAMALAYDTPVLVHADGPYSYHFSVATLNCPMAEYIFYGDPAVIAPIRAPAVGEPLPAGGRIAVPDRPGFGVAIDRTQLRDWRAAFVAPATVTDARDPS